MSKMTVAEAAEHFEVSKEAIHNRVRRGTLNSTVENGVKYVMLPDEKPLPSSESRFYDYIEKENERLKAKNEQLESEINRLRDQREAMLIAEREKIEQIYKERDEQLRKVPSTPLSRRRSPQSLSKRNRSRFLNRLPYCRNAKKSTRRRLSRTAWRTSPILLRTMISTTSFP